MLLALLLTVLTASSPGDACPFYVGSPPGFPPCPEGQIFDMNALIACQEAYTASMEQAVDLACGLWNVANSNYEHCYQNALHNLDTCMHDGIHNPSECMAQFVSDVQACLSTWTTTTGSARSVYETYKRQANKECLACFAGLCHEPHHAPALLLAQTPHYPDCGPLYDPPTPNYEFGHFDFPPTNTNCTGVLDLPCFQACQAAWMTATANARAAANDSWVSCEANRIESERTAYRNYRNALAQAMANFDSCMASGGGYQGCSDFYCSTKHLQDAIYHGAVVAAEAQCAQCKQHVLEDFVHATTAATNAFNTCVAGCCNE